MIRQICPIVNYVTSDGLYLESRIEGFTLIPTLLTLIPTLLPHDSVSFTLCSIQL